MSKRFSLSRRTVLKGAFGTALSLPLLECMLNGNGTAHADGTAFPCRYFLFYCPTSLVTSGSRTEAMTPTTDGAAWALTSVLQPLGTHGVKPDVTVISGLFVPPVDAPGAYESDHHGQAPYAVMTGVRSGWTEPKWRPQGWSADQLVVRALNPTTRMKSLYYQLDSQTGGTYLSCEQTTGFSDEPPIVYKQLEPQTSPTLAYRQLFTGFTPPGAMVDPQAELELRLRKSSLSYAKDRLAALQSKLGAADRRTLDEHLTRVRALEQRLATTMPGTVTQACRDPMLPATDPADVSTDVPNQDARAALFVDLVEVAFACDLTRVLTVGGASVMTGSGMRSPLWNMRGGLHGEVQHRGDQSELDDANRWFVDFYARCLARFKATPEGTRTVLDNTAALFVMEGGKGLSNDPMRSGDGGGDPNHSVDHALMMLGGRVGGLVPGRHLNLTGRDLHHGTVFNSVYQALGAQTQHGEVTGTVGELFT